MQRLVQGCRGKVVMGEVELGDRVWDVLGHQVQASGGAVYQRRIALAGTEIWTQRWGRETVMSRGQEEQHSSQGWPPWHRHHNLPCQTESTATVRPHCVVFILFFYQHFTMKSGFEVRSESFMGKIESQNKQLHFLFDQ